MKQTHNKTKVIYQQQKKGKIKKDENHGKRKCKKGRVAWCGFWSFCLVSLVQ